MQIAFSIVQVIICVVLILVVLFQHGDTQGLGAIAGGNDNFLSKSKAKSIDAKLAQATKWVALAFAVLTVVLNCL